MSETNPPKTETMTVTVVDRFAMTQAWGNGGGIVLRTVQISTKCPVCGEPRGMPHWSRFCEDGDWYDVSTWTNPCGHTDKYDAVLREGGVYTGEEKITNGWAGPAWKGVKQSAT